MQSERSLSEMATKCFGILATFVLPMLVHSAYVQAKWVRADAPAPPMGQRSVTSAIMNAVGVADTVEHFAGTFYGVKADVALNMNTRVAHVALSGYPVAGRVEGDGWLKDAGKERGEVMLEPDFAARLARRFVSIQWAALDRDRHTVTVHATVPIIGSLELVLHRA